MYVWPTGCFEAIFWKRTQVKCIYKHRPVSAKSIYMYLDQYSWISTSISALKCSLTLTPNIVRGFLFRGLVLLPHTQAGWHLRITAPLPVHLHVQLCNRLCVTLYVILELQVTDLWQVACKNRFINRLSLIFYYIPSNMVAMGTDRLSLIYIDENL